MLPTSLPPFLPLPPTPHQNLLPPHPTHQLPFPQPYFPHSSYYNPPPATFPTQHPPIPYSQILQITPPENNHPHTITLTPRPIRPQPSISSIHNTHDGGPVQGVENRGGVVNIGSDFCIDSKVFKLAFDGG